MKVNILFFAALREAVGCADTDLRLQADTATVADVLDALKGRGEAWRDALGVANLRCAVNHEFAKLNSAVADGDEVAFFPPVTGG